MENARFTFVSVVVLVVCVYIVDATVLDRVKRSDPVRCSLTSGFLCRWTCRGFGHSDGFCDDGNECRCSEQELEKYVCGGDVGNKTADALCAGWCQFKGKQTGDCDHKVGECLCTEDRLEGSNVKCVADSICSFYCQFKEKKATGECTGAHGWDCLCLSNSKRNELAASAAASAAGVQ